MMTDVGDGNLASAFSNPGYVVILHLMTNFGIVFKEGLVDASLNRKIDPLYKFVDIVNPKKAVDPIMMVDKSLMGFQ